MARISLRNGKILWIIVLAVLVIGLSGLAIWLALSRPPGIMAEAPSPYMAQATGEVSLEYGVMMSMMTGETIRFMPGDVLLFVPARATDVEGAISIISREPDLFPDAGEAGWSRPQIVNVEYLDPNGIPYPKISFVRPLEICFAMTEEDWALFASRPEDYQVQVYDEGNSAPAWKAVPQVEHSDRFQLCGVTDHLSLFALAIKGQVAPIETMTGPYEP
jgi:hypothetical protein